MSNPAPPSADDLERLAKLWFCAAQALSPRQLSEIDAWTRQHPARVSGGGVEMPRATKSA
jgi:hypothetical protein